MYVHDQKKKKKESVAVIVTPPSTRQLGLQAHRYTAEDANDFLHYTQRKHGWGILGVSRLSS